MKKFLILLATALVTFATIAIASDYYDATGIPVQRSTISSAEFRSEFAAITSGISDKLPALTGNGDNWVRINAGGTGLASSTTAALITAVGLDIGVDVQAWDEELDELALLNNGDNRFIVGTGSIWTSESSGTARTSMGAEPADADLTVIAGLAVTADYFMVADGGQWRSISPVIASGKVMDAAQTSGSFTVTFEDMCTTSPTSVWAWTLLGDIVVIQPAALSAICTSDSVQFKTAVQIVPQALRPTISTRIALDVENNGTMGRGCLLINSGGQVSLLRLVNGTTCSSSWTNSGDKGAYFGNFSYSVDNT